MATLKPEHLAELHVLRDQSMALLDVLGRIEPSFAVSARELKRIIEDTANAQNLRGLREAARDLRQMLVAVPPDRRSEGLSHVRRTTGHPLEAEEARDAAAAQRTLERGRVRNDREYYVLRGYLEALEASGRADAEATVRALLDGYRNPRADAV